MAIIVTCTCGAQFRAKDEHAGRQANCPHCGESMTIPMEISDDSEGGPDVEDYPEEGDPPLPRKKRSWFKPGTGNTLLGMNCTLGKILLLLGLVMVLFSRGCSTLAGRAKSRANAKFELLQNEFADKQAAKRADVDETIAELNDSRTDLRSQLVAARDRESRDEIQKQLTEVDKKHAEERKSLRKIESDSLKEQRRLQRGQWREQYESARDSSLYRNTGSLWREWFFVIGTIILSVGLLTVGFTGQGSERTICLIMIAIITFSLYIGGAAWIDSIFDAVESSKRSTPRLTVPEARR